MGMKIEGEHKRQRQLNRLLERIHLCNVEDCRISFQEGNGFRVKKEGAEISVVYEKDSQLYRSLLLAAELAEAGKDGEIVQEEEFDTKGVMLDMSRAGVMKVEAVKEYIEYMALMGLNALMLYMEDVFEVEGLPYFGYMRGRYTAGELKEIDRYGQEFGVEVIPCIQTLGHFEQYLKWTEGKEITDTSTVLLAGKQETYEFLDKIIRTISECFTTRKIHIGMDEAWGLGTGNYLKQNGYKDGTEIFCDHIRKVKEITDKYHLNPMIWSDMYFRLGSKTGEYYDREVEVPGFVREFLPENVRLTYWDYYHHDEETYRYMIEKHRKITEDLIFAGGIWNWTGFLPDYAHTFKTAQAGLKVCKEKGIRDVYATIWGDDGCETSQMFSLIGCALYGEHSYTKEVNMESLRSKVRLLFQADIQDFIGMSEALYPCRGSNDTLSVKQILYSDVMCGLVDRDIEGACLPEHYRNLEKRYRALSEQEGYYKDYFAYTAAVCRAAGGKAEVVEHLHKGYREDRELLRKVKEEELPALAEAFQELKEIHFKLWNQSCRPFGFEIVDGRYGVQLSRIESARLRLEEYLSGGTDRLAELEEERLPYNGKHNISHFYAGMASSFMIKGY